MISRNERERFKMKVQELITELEKYPLDSDVEFICQYNDEGRMRFIGGDGVEVSFGYEEEILRILVDTTVTDN